MKKLLNKISVILSFVLLISATFAPISHAKNLDDYLENNNVVLEVYDEKLNDNFKISLLYAENGKSRVQAINSKEEIVYDYSFDINNDTMTSELTGEVVNIDIPIVDLEGKTSTQSSNCNGQPTSQYLSYTVKQVALGIVGTATLVAVTAKLLGLIALSTGLKITGTGIGTAANAVLSAILGGNYNKSVYLRVNFVCSRMWHSDPFEPGGGFYFYGMKYKNTTYRGLW